MLDVSAAFDTVDHSTILTRLERKFGIRGVCLDWLGSYLTNRTICAIHSRKTSDTVSVVCLVLLGSVLGPLQIILHTADFAANHDVTLRSYTDDLQIYQHSNYNSDNEYWNEASLKHSSSWLPIV